MERVRVIQGDCLKEMRKLPPRSIDLVLADPPYGTTACKWDSVIPLEPMWRAIKRVAKANAAVVLTASQPFTTTLIASNRAWFRFQDVWDKGLPSGHLNAKKLPMRIHEDVVVFSRKRLGGFSYNPQMRVGRFRTHGQPTATKCYGKQKPFATTESDEYYPTSIIRVSNANQKAKDHPTQKPVALMSYLIRTYSNEGDLVLDFCAGSGTTGVACVQTNRRGILIEREIEYVEVARRRIAEAAVEFDFFLKG